MNFAKFCFPNMNMLKKSLIFNSAKVNQIKTSEGKKNIK